MRKIRHLAIGLLTLACGAIAPWPAPAQDIAKDAAALVQALGDDLLEVIANNTLTSADREARFHEMLVDRTDMPTIGRFVLGRHWRTATDAQKAEFLGLFEDLVVKMFNRRVSDYRGERFAIAGARVDGDSVLVTTGITGPQRQPV
ncbi:MAG: ABC transporter substrate-binding protein, partial [Proteobacteria bacterium]|nr:ABC transporter substrate-binding protein [Pseudomonadota bacterium]